MDPTPLLVTRAAAEIPALAAVLGGRRQVVPAPALVFASVKLPSDALDSWRGAPLDLLIASARALPALASVALDPAWRVLALAPATASALRAAGLRVDLSVEGGGRALGLAARCGPVVGLGSDRGGAEIRAVRPDAVLLVAYRTACPDSLGGEAEAVLASESPFDLLFSSPSTVENFRSLQPSSLSRARRIYAHGGSTGCALSALGLSFVPADLSDPASLE